MCLILRDGDIIVTTLPATIRANIHAIAPATETSSIARNDVAIEQV